MTMTPRIRKVALTTHIISSVGWFGSVATFLALAIAGLIIRDNQMVRASYFGMLLITQFVIIPFGLASLLTGIVSSLGTEWGLFRYYWIVIKLVITVLSSIGLLMHLRPIKYLANVAAHSAIPSADLPVQIQLAVVSGVALLALLVATVLSVYKPKGVTRYGWQKLQERRKELQPS